MLFHWVLLTNILQVLYIYENWQWTIYKVNVFVGTKSELLAKLLFKILMEISSKASSSTVWILKPTQRYYFQDLFLLRPKGEWDETLLEIMPWGSILHKWHDTKESVWTNILLHRSSAFIGFPPYRKRGKSEKLFCNNNSSDYLLSVCLSTISDWQID